MSEYVQAPQSYVGLCPCNSASAKNMSSQDQLEIWDIIWPVLALPSDVDDVGLSLNLGNHTRQLVQVMDGDA